VLQPSVPHGAWFAAGQDDAMMSGSTLTHEPDLLELYRWAVQDPEIHATVLAVMYGRTRPGKQPAVLREDFAGTGAESVAWIALKEGRRAIAIDLDGPTLEWAQRRAARLLGPRADRIAFIQGDSMMVGPDDERVPPADIISVLNFSILYLRNRQSLHRYLQQARESLASDGVLVLNAFGGPAAVRPGTTRHHVTPKPRLPAEAPIPAFDYLWEVRTYEPESREIECLIHFQVTGNHERPELREAFRYLWRLWSLPELVEACTHAGFTDVKVWRHTYDASRGAAGIFLGPVEAAAVDGLDQWTAYIVAAA
jgi:SAM-dependent methyltransferase